MTAVLNPFRIRLLLKGTAQVSIPYFPMRGGNGYFKFEQ